MIIGYLLFDYGGTLLIDDQFLSLLTDEKESLFAMFMTAVTHAMNKILNQRLKHMELEKMHLYFGYDDPYMLVIISEIENDEYQVLAEKIIREIKETNISPDDINFNPVSKQTMRSLIRQIILRTPPSIAHLKKLAEILFSMTDFIENKESIKIERLLPEKINLIASKPKKRYKEKITLEELIESYLSGELHLVIEKASGLFDSEHGEFARILYAKAGIILNMYDPEIRAPPHGEIYAIIQEIKDPISRKYLELELRSFFEIPKHSAYRDVFLKHLNEIREKQKTSKIWEAIYDIVFTPNFYVSFMDEIIRKYEQKSPFLASMAKEIKIINEIFHHPPRDITDWLSRFSEIKILFEEAIKKNSIERFHYFHVLVFTLSLGALVPNLSVEDGIKIFNYFAKYTEQYYEKIIGKTKRILSIHRAQSYYFMYNLLLRPLFEISDKKERKRIISRRRKRIINMIRYINKLVKNMRIPLSIYYITMASLFSILSRLFAEEKKAIEEIPRLLHDIIDENMINLWNTQQHDFAYYYISVLDTIGNTALLLNMETIRKNMLMKVAYKLNRLADLLSEVPVIGCIARMLAIRYYLLCGDEQGEKEAQKILEMTKETKSPMLAYAFEKVYEEYS